MKGELIMGWTEYEKKLKEWYGYSETKNQDDIIIDIYNSQRPAGSYKMTHTCLLYTSPSPRDTT